MTEELLEWEVDFEDVDVPSEDEVEQAPDDLDDDDLEVIEIGPAAEPGEAEGTEGLDE